ncbi:MAG: hypothetical protein ACYCZY_08180 [Lacisediminihabitans sp.]
MTVDGFGSSLMIALATLLWLVYLVPTWFRRREYLATERNALRLQQTLRVMAETAEVPREVRVETSARSAAAQEQLLRKQLQREAAIARAQDAAADRAAARRLAEIRPAIAADVAAGSVVLRRLRRSRAFTALVLLASLIGAGFGVAQLLAASSWLLLASAAVVAVASSAMLGQMAAVGRARAELARSLRARPQTVTAPARTQAPETPAQPGWTPVPVPKPLYLSRPQTDRAVAASLDAVAELRVAAAAGEHRLREAQQSPQVTPIIRPAVAASAPAVAPALASRFARMGYVDENELGVADLDAALRRRRASAAG